MRLGCPWGPLGAGKRLQGAQSANGGLAGIVGIVHHGQLGRPGRRVLAKENDEKGSCHPCFREKAGAVQSRPQRWAVGYVSHDKGVFMLKTMMAALLAPPLALQAEAQKP